MFVMISEDVPFVLKAGYVKCICLSPTGLIRSTVSTFYSDRPIDLKGGSTVSYHSSPVGAVDARIMRDGLFLSNMLD